MGKTLLVIVATACFYEKRIGLYPVARRNCVISEYYISIATLRNEIKAAAILCIRGSQLGHRHL